MRWIDRSQPPETDDPPATPPDRLAELAAERAALCVLIRPRVRSARQDRIRSRIEQITREMLRRKA